MKPAASLTSRYFDDVYRASTDPWRFETSAYEAAKVDATIAALGDRRFARAFEIGCSIGVLSERLAGVAGELIAVDVSKAPLVRARQRCAALDHVHFARMDVPREFPQGRFDLVVMSEVGYYWSRDDLGRAAERIEDALGDGGSWLLVHWTPEVADYPLTGDEVHEAILARSGPAGATRHVRGARHETYRLDLFVRRPRPREGTRA